MTLYLLQVEPTRVLPELPVMLPGALTVDESGAIRGVARLTVVARGDGLASGSHATLLPPELYLRQLLDFDLASDDALLDFMGSFGLLGSGSLNGKSSGAYETPVSTMRSARERAAVLRDTSRALLANEGMLEPDELFALWESRGGNPLASVIFQNDPLEVAVKLASDVVTKALAPFGPRVSTPGSSKHEVFGIPLESAVCAQMFNHIAEGAAYRRCALPSCSRAFVRQVGRAVKGQFKLEGVEYCSPQCARAAASKRYRDRKRDERMRTAIERDSE